MNLPARSAEHSDQVLIRAAAAAMLREGIKPETWRAACREDIPDSQMAFDLADAMEDVRAELAAGPAVVQLR